MPSRWLSRDSYSNEMGTTDHNKILGIIHVVYGMFSLVVLVIVTFLVLGVVGVASASEGQPAPFIIVAVVMLLVLAVNIILAAPSFIAGYAMLKRKAWAKPAAIVAAILDGFSFPFGTALCVYTLWFMFSDEGKVLYDQLSRRLPPAPPQWPVATGKKEPEYVLPDWR